MNGSNVCNIYDIRLKWKTFIKTQQAYDKIVAKLKGGVEDTLVRGKNKKFLQLGKDDRLSDLGQLKRVKG